MKSAAFLVEAKKKSVTELKEQARVLGQELMKLRFRRATGQLTQSHRLGDARRELARVKTLIVAAQRGQVASQGGEPFGGVGVKPKAEKETAKKPSKKAAAKKTADKKEAGKKEEA